MPRGRGGAGGVSIVVCMVLGLDLEGGVGGSELYECFEPCGEAFVVLRYSDMLSAWGDL